MAVERPVRALGVVAGQEGGEGRAPLGAGGVGALVGPAVEQRGDKALRLAVGARRVGAGEQVADAERFAGLAVQRRAVPAPSASNWSTSRTTRPTVTTASGREGQAVAVKRVVLLELVGRDVAEGGVQAGLVEPAGKASCSSASSSTSSAAASSAGSSRRTCAPPWSSTPCAWRSPNAVRAPTSPSSTTATGALNKHLR